MRLQLKNKEKFFAPGFEWSRQYPESIRKIIYTTNAIESLNSQLRRVTKNKRVFPSDESVFKTPAKWVKLQKRGKSELEPQMDYADSKLG